MIKDHRTKLSIGDVDRVLDGDLDALIHAYLVWRKTGKTANDTGDDLVDDRATRELGNAGSRPSG